VARVWDVSQDVPCVSIYKGHWGNLFSVTWAPFQDDLVISGGTDGSLQVWRPSKSLPEELDICSQSIASDETGDFNWNDEVEEFVPPDLDDIDVELKRKMIRCMKLIKSKTHYPILEKAKAELKIEEPKMDELEAKPARDFDPSWRSLTRTNS
jgi:WD40 repeat protein